MNAWLASKGLEKHHPERVETIVRKASYIFSPKVDHRVMQLMQDEASKLGWETIGDTQVHWGIKWREKLTDTAGEDWWQARQSWADSD